MICKIKDTTALQHSNSTDEHNTFRTGFGINSEVVRTISEQKNEPGWMTDFRLKALEIFMQKPMPTWGADLSLLPIDDICYYIKPLSEQHHTWEAVPDRIKKTFESLGIPQAEQNFLAGVGAQYESEMVYKQLKKEWQDRGVVFIDTGTALTTHQELFRKYFATVIPPHDNKFAALNSAVWSGGSFVYVPPGVHIDMPLQAYFRINEPRMGQFERTLIIADTGSFVHYVEGCSAPVYRTASLHSAVVELIALPGAHIRYTTIQNWSSNVYNLVTKRGVAYKDSTVEWIDGNFGSKVTMKYPCVVLKEPGARANIISIAVAGSGQHQDAGAKVIHLAPHTSSNIVSKSITKDGGRSSYRGLLKVVNGAHDCNAKIQCDALLLDDISQTDTYPTVIANESDVDIAHEASVSRINQDQLLYLQMRGMSAQTARAFIVNGFIDLFVKELPMEYAVEINRLIAAEMEGSIG
jgi:Fe-S cluster assembly protein SufB